MYNKNNSYVLILIIILYYYSIKMQNDLQQENIEVKEEEKKIKRDTEENCSSGNTSEVNETDISSDNSSKISSSKSSVGFECNANYPSIHPMTKVGKQGKSKTQDFKLVKGDEVNEVNEGKHL